MSVRLILVLGGVLAALLTGGAASAKPLVVILADSRGTVATDLTAPYAILAESGAVEVKVVSATADPVRLTPGVAWVKPQMTLAELERTRPEGADVVIVPAYAVDEDPARRAWLQAQLRRGARIVAICNGARALAAAGLLEGRAATVHWYSQGKVARRYPGTRWRRDARWVTDGPITTTAGMSAAEPATLQLLRELAGETTMRQTAARLGMPLPEPGHDGRRYRLTPGGMATTVLNTLAFWGHEKVAVPLEPGFDELAFGTALDAWSRTYRSRAWATGAAATTSRHGLTIYRSASTPRRFDRRASLPGPDVMTRTFAQIRAVYGPATARFVALQFEHPQGAVG